MPKISRAGGPSVEPVYDSEGEELVAGVQQDPSHVPAGETSLTGITAVAEASVVHADGSTDEGPDNEADGTGDGVEGDGDGLEESKPAPRKAAAKTPRGGRP